MKRVIRYFQAPTFTAAEWSARNPYLRKGEVGYLQEAGLVIGLKVGPGLWNDLALVGNDKYPYADVVTNPIGDATGVLQNESIALILKKMLSPYGVPAITVPKSNAQPGGTFLTTAIREIGQSLVGPVQITFNISNVANLLGATPINVTAGSIFTNEGNFANVQPISLLLGSPLNPATTTVVTISLKATHTNGQTSGVNCTISFFPKLMWGVSLLENMNGAQFMAMTNRGTLVSNSYQNDYSFNGNGYSWLAIPTMLNPTNLVFTDITNPSLPANYAMESKGVISINNGVATYNYSLYRSTFNLIHPTILRLR